MSVQEIKDWNSAYGLSKTLLRNLVVGVIVMQFMGNAALSISLKRSNDKVSALQDQRVQDIKEFNARLQHEKDIQDSLNRDYLKSYFELKSKTK